MKIQFILFFIIAGSVFYGCSNVDRSPGHVYMPDMAYSRAYETYAARDSDKFTADANELGRKIFFNNMPVPGTIARGEEMPFLIAQDVPGDSTNHTLARQVVNPLTQLDTPHTKEAERLYLINCGICHGPKLDGNGPLYKDGNGPYPAKPATLVGDPKIESLTEGEMFYTVTYGKNLMGSYASQLSRTQRWMVIAYIKSKQLANSSKTNAAADSTSSATAK